MRDGPARTHDFYEQGTVRTPQHPNALRGPLARPPRRRYHASPRCPAPESTPPVNNLVLLILCFVLGVVLRLTRRMPDNAPPVMNSWIVHVALPAVVFLHVPTMQLRADLAFPALMPWIVFLAISGLVLSLRKVMRWDSATTGCLMLTAGLGNTSFVGLPMTQAFYGPEGVPIALVADQLGSFLTLSTLGLVTAARMSAGEPSARVIIKRVVTFPPFIALCIAATLGRALVTPELLPFTVPHSISEASQNVFQTLASTLAPLALFSVGFQLRLGEVRTRAADLSLGLLLKLIVAPGLMAGIAVATGLGLHGLVSKVTLLEAGMAPMITAGIIATEHKLDPVLCGLMVAVGIPLSFVTLGALVWLLG